MTFWDGFVSVFNLLDHFWAGAIAGAALVMFITCDLVFVIYGIVMSFKDSGEK